MRCLARCCQLSASWRLAGLARYFGTIVELITPIQRMDVPHVRRGVC